MIAMIAMIMTSTMVNVAIPNIMGAFGVGQDQAHGYPPLSLNHDSRHVIKWLVSSYVWATKYIYSFLNFFFLLRAFLGNMCRVLRLPFWQGLRKGCAGIIQPLALSTVYLAYPPPTRRCNGVVWLRNSFWSYNRSFFGRPDYRSI